MKSLERAWLQTPAGDGPHLHLTHNVVRATNQRNKNTCIFRRISQGTRIYSSGPVWILQMEVYSCTNLITSLALQTFQLCTTYFAQIETSAQKG